MDHPDDTPTVAELTEQVRRLELGYELLATYCRGTLDCRGSSKEIVNFVHDYCAKLLAGEYPEINDWE